MSKSTLYIKVILFVMTFSACESHEQKTDEAFHDYKKEKLFTLDSIINSKDSISQLIKKMPNKESIKINECFKFRTDLEAKVKINEQAITELKTEHKSNTRIYRKIMRLESINKLFIIQLKQFEETAKNERKNFEVKIEQELNDMELSIKDYNK